MTNDDNPNIFQTLSGEQVETIAGRLGVSVQSVWDVIAAMHEYTPTDILLTTDVVTGWILCEFRHGH